MDQPLFSCTKCFQNFPQSEMSRSGQTCKGCNHHTTFKQCEYCKSDFKHYVYGDICPRCQSLRSKYGEPQPCSICMLKTAFGSALVCQRCLHYRNRFGEPRQCQTCGNMCAFLKDQASREKVDGQILCWVCTYNFKLARSRERSSHGTSKRRHEAIQISDSNKCRSNMESPLKRTRPDDYTSRKSDVNSSSAQQAPNQVHSLDSVYNEQILTIGQLQDEVTHLNRKLMQKEAELLAKDRIIAELRSEMIEVKETHEDRILKIKAAAQLEQDRLSATIRQLQKEKITLTQGMKRQKGSSNLTPTARLRYSASSIALFNPDSPIPYSATEKPHSAKRLIKPTPDHSEVEDEEVSSDHSKRPKPESEVPIDLGEESQSAISQGFPQPSDEESNLSPHIGSVEDRKTNTNSPDLTPSVTSGSQTDDEEHKVAAIHKGALGLETPSESEEEQEDELEEGEDA